MSAWAYLKVRTSTWFSSWPSSSPQSEFLKSIAVSVSVPPKDSTCETSGTLEGWVTACKKNWLSIFLTTTKPDQIGIGSMSKLTYRFPKSLNSSGWFIYLVLHWSVFLKNYNSESECISRAPSYSRVIFDPIDVRSSPICIMTGKFWPYERVLV